MPFLEGGKYYISLDTIFQREFSVGYCKSGSMPFLRGGKCDISLETSFEGEFSGGCCGS